MSKVFHVVVVSFYVLTVLAAIVVLAQIGNSYYSLPLEERCFHPAYEMLKPSGWLGHGLGVVGTALILTGLFGYMGRKRLKIMSGLGLLKYWLEWHIFFCTLGTVLVVFHTSFKFGGLISVGFWSLVGVWLSGLAGRYIYLQIPRTREGRVMSLNEIENLQTTLETELLLKYNVKLLDVKAFNLFELKLNIPELSISDAVKIRHITQQQKILNFRIRHLDRMKRLMNYWHFVHLPFALIMLIIMAIHVAVAVFFGFTWIF